MQMQAFRKMAERAAGPLGIIGTVAGFVGDVLAPLGNFAPWVSLLSLVAFCISVGIYIGMRRRIGQEAGETIMPGIIVISAGSTIIFALWAVIFAAGPDNGYLADNIEPIAKLQAQILNLQEDVTEIKQTTQETAENVEALATAQAESAETSENTAQNVEAMATAQAAGFADIQSAFADLQAGQTLVADPQTPQEWYSNARIYQLKGDTAKAVAAYEGYLPFALEYIDPLEQYVDLLKSTEGIARTRQIMSDWFNQQPDNKALELIVAQLQDFPEERMARLNDLAQRAPDFAPVFYALGQEHSTLLRQSFTQAEVEAQAEAFGKLLELETNQVYSRYFIDKERAQENLTTAKTLMESYSIVAGRGIEFLPYFAYDGLHLTAMLPDANAQQLLFSLDDPNPTNDNGKITAGTFTTVNTQIGPIPLEIGKHSVYVRYLDANGVMSDVVEYAYEVKDITVNFNQMPFDFSTNGIPGMFNVFVTNAPSDSIEMYTYYYSLDSDSLDQQVQGLGMSGLIQIAPLEKGEHVLYLQAADPDGKKTEVVEFAFTVQ